MDLTTRAKLNKLLAKGIDYAQTALCTFDEESCLEYADLAEAALNEATTLLKRYVNEHPTTIHD